MWRNPAAVSGSFRFAERKTNFDKIRYLGSCFQWTALVLIILMLLISVSRGTISKRQKVNFYNYCYSLFQ